MEWYNLNALILLVCIYGRSDDRPSGIHGKGRGQLPLIFRRQLPTTPSDGMWHYALMRVYKPGKNAITPGGTLPTRVEDTDGRHHIGSS